MVAWLTWGSSVAGRAEGGAGGCPRMGRCGRAGLGGVLRILTSVALGALALAAACALPRQPPAAPSGSQPPGAGWSQAAAQPPVPGHGLGNAPVPGQALAGGSAPVPEEAALDPGAALRPFLYGSFRPLVEELGPILDRHLRVPQPPAPGHREARLQALQADRERLQRLLAAVHRLQPPAQAQRLVAATGLVVAGTLLLVEREMGWVLAGRWPDPAHVAAQRQALAERYVDPWLGELLRLVALAGDG